MHDLKTVFEKNFNCNTEVAKLALRLHVASSTRFISCRQKKAGLAWSSWNKVGFVAVEAGKATEAEKIVFPSWLRKTPFESETLACALRGFFKTYEGFDTY